MACRRAETPSRHWNADCRLLLWIYTITANFIFEFCSFAQSLSCFLKDETQMMLYMFTTSKLKCQCLHKSAWRRRKKTEISLKTKLLSQHHDREHIFNALSHLALPHFYIYFYVTTIRIDLFYRTFIPLPLNQIYNTKTVLMLSQSACIWP